VESSLEQRERKDKEKAEYVRARQERLGHVSVEPEVVVEKPKTTRTAKKKS
jgi:hypothetical protein